MDRARPRADSRRTFWLIVAGGSLLILLGIGCIGGVVVGVPLLLRAALGGEETPLPNGSVLVTIRGHPRLIESLPDSGSYVPRPGKRGVNPSYQVGSYFTKGDFVAGELVEYWDPLTQPPSNWVPLPVRYFIMKAGGAPVEFESESSWEAGLRERGLESRGESP